MIHFNDLKADTRFEGFSDTTQRVLSVLNLTNDQVDEVLNPVNKVLDHKSFSDIATFIRNADKLMVCGDYDADGVSSTAIALLIAQELGLDKPGYYIPNRFKDGYGINETIVRLAYDKGYSHILVVDNGVKATEALELALKLGLHVAVVDHHVFDTFNSKIPLLHPQLLSSYGAAMSAGGLMCALAEHMGVMTPKILALGALATIADVMPLWGKNRELVRRGLEVINTQRIKAFDLLSGSKDVYTAQDLAFKVIPKINSVGRMADIVNMNTMVEYLITDNDAILESYAVNVLEVDAFRKLKSKENLDLAKRMVRDDKVLVISHPDFHEGIMGIVANQLMQQYDKPAILLKQNESVFKGSGRSNTISLQSLFESLNDKYFEAFGGHDFAYGMSVHEMFFSSFYEDVQVLSADLKSVKVAEKIIKIEAPLPDLFFEEVKRLEPLGAAFKLPEFMISLPESFNAFPLKGYGYKLSFPNFWLKDAVYFNANIMRDLVVASTWAVGSFSKSPKFGVSFNISQLGV